jgi:hypothetical protein
MTKNVDTNAILARREAFINSVLSKEEAENAKGGAVASCLIPTICLSIIDPCHTICQIPQCLIAPQPCLSIAEPCLTIAEVDPTILHNPDIQDNISNGF